jgi:predicted nucleotidyltransferase component of viral defense system
VITEGYLRRHIAATQATHDIALLDVAQEFILGYLEQQGYFDSTLVFKGGTALRKFLFGSDGRFSVDIDLALARGCDEDFVQVVLDDLDGMRFGGIEVHLERRRGPNAQMVIDTRAGRISQPAAVSIRPSAAWLPPVRREPVQFEWLDRGLEAMHIKRARPPIVDVREIAAEKIAAFRRRRHARDLYDLDHLGSLLQGDFPAVAIARLAALKIYFDVVDEGIGVDSVPTSLNDVLGISAADVVGAHDLGLFRAERTDVSELLARCRTRYAAFGDLADEHSRLATTCSQRDRYRAQQTRASLVAALCT